MRRRLRVVHSRHRSVTSTPRGGFGVVLVILGVAAIAVAAIQWAIQ